MHIHLKKATTIKDEITFLQKVGLIYPREYTSQVSNPILLMNKHDTTYVCTNFHDLKKSFPKDNYPTPFTNHVIDECVGHKILYLMDGFS
jgi:hypothetical protein